MNHYKLLKAKQFKNKAIIIHVCGEQ